MIYIPPCPNPWDYPSDGDYYEALDAYNEAFSRLNEPEWDISDSLEEDWD